MKLENLKLNLETDLVLNVAKRITDSSTVAPPRASFAMQKGLVLLKICLAVMMWSSFSMF